MTRNDIFTRILLAYADLGWAVPTGIENGSTASMLDTLVLSETILATRNEVRA